jgi:hypothetical protein
MVWVGLDGMDVLMERKSDSEKKSMLFDADFGLRFWCELSSFGLQLKVRGSLVKGPSGSCYSYEISLLLESSLLSIDERSESFQVYTLSYGLSRAVLLVLAPSFSNNKSLFPHRTIALVLSHDSAHGPSPMLNFSACIFSLRQHNRQDKFLEHLHRQLCFACISLLLPSHK